MSARIGLKLQGLEKIKKKWGARFADQRGFTRIYLEISENPPNPRFVRVLFLTVFTMNIEFAKNFSVDQYSTPDSH